MPATMLQRNYRSVPEQVLRLQRSHQVQRRERMPRIYHQEVQRKRMESQCRTSFLKQVRTRIRRQATESRMKKRRQELQLLVPGC
jgi:predicted metal-dependent HD superfamily phosphohydrolase